MDVPISLTFEARQAGITFIWFVDLEPQSVNGSSTLQLDRPKLLEIVRLLSPSGRLRLLSLFQDQILVPVARRTREIRIVLERQESSLSVVKDVIAFLESYE